jgi:hypothetical protein
MAVLDFIWIMTSIVMFRRHIHHDAHDPIVLGDKSAWSRVWSEVSQGFQQTTKSDPRDETWPGQSAITIDDFNATLRL